MRELLEELDVVVVIPFLPGFVMGLLAAFQQAVLLRREVNLKLEQGVHNFVDVLVDPDQVVLNEVTLSELNPLFAFLLLALKLVNVVDIVVLLLALFGLTDGQLGPGLDKSAFCENALVELISELVEQLGL